MKERNEKYVDDKKRHPDFRQIKTVGEIFFLSKDCGGISPR